MTDKLIELSCILAVGALVCANGCQTKIKLESHPAAPLITGVVTSDTEGKCGTATIKVP